jgi:hypothetical protein
VILGRENGQLIVRPGSFTRGFFRGAIFGLVLVEDKVKKRLMSKDLGG